MQIKKLKLDNFAKFDDFEIEFNDKVTRLIGVNGSGKTTVGLTAIWAAFKGIAEKGTDYLIGDRFRFIGSNGRDAKIELILYDETKKKEIVLHRKISDAGNHISFEAPEGYETDEAWLLNLLQVSFLSAKYFTQLSGKQQALTLGIDTSKIDFVIEDLKEDARLIRSEIKSIGLPVRVDKVEMINPNELIMEKQKILQFNTTQKESENNIIDAKILLEALIKQEKELEHRIEKGTKHLDKLPQPKQQKSTKEIDAKINNATEIQKQALKYQRYADKRKRLNDNEDLLNQNLLKQKENQEKRLQQIKEFKIIKEMSIDEDGGLLINNKPVKEPYFSRSELEILVADLHLALNPDMKVRFIDDFEVFDDKNKKLLLKKLLDSKFQVIVAQVGDEKIDKNSIVLRECKVVNK